MLLGVIPMFCFGILRIFGGKLENLGIIGLLRRNVKNPRCGVDPRQGVGYPHSSETKVPKWHPSGAQRRCIVVSRHNYCSQREIFWIFVSEHLVFVQQ